jgi:hypothetical protein
VKLIERRVTEAARGKATEADLARAGRLERWTRELAKPRHLEAQAHENARVRRFLASFLAELGYTVSVQGRYGNVVALPREREAVTLVGAHFDSVPTTAGADDNASGVAVLLEVAAELAKRKPGGNVGFVAFNAEEDGMLGSADFVAEGLTELSLDVQGIHVLEMVGFATDAPGSQRIPLELPVRAPDTGNFLGLLANGRSRALLERTFERAAGVPDLGLVGLQTVLGIERFLPILLLSDHAPFWRAGLPALMWTDTSFLRNPHYHGPSDTPETLDYVFMARIAALVAGSVRD